MPKSKIVDEAEAVRWIEEGKTYRWMVEEYLRKYDVTVVQSTFANLRMRRGLKRRIAMNGSLIPWSIDERHQGKYPLQMLRFEARKRDGLPLREDEAERLESWLEKLAEYNAVVHYDPETLDGFHLIPREEDDVDIIRAPKKTTRVRRPVD